MGRIRDVALALTGGLGAEYVRREELTELLGQVAEAELRLGSLYDKMHTLAARLAKRQARAAESLVPAQGSPAGPSMPTDETAALRRARFLQRAGPAAARYLGPRVPGVPPEHEATGVADESGHTDGSRRDAG